MTFQNDHVTATSQKHLFICEKSFGTTELHYSTKKQEHSFSILKAFFVQQSSEYETSDNDQKVN